MSRRGSGRAFRELAATNARELVRERQTFFFVLVFPFLFLALFFFISRTQGAGSYTVGLAGVPAAPAGALRADPHLHVQTTPSVATGLSAGLDAVVTPSGGRYLVVLQKDKDSAAGVISSALRRVHVTATARTVTGAEPTDAFRYGIPAILIMAFGSLAFFGTATPMIQLRQRGTLELLSTTPLRRSTFIAAQAPARLAIGLGQLLVLTALSAATGFLVPSHLAGLLLGSLLGLALFFSTGYAVAARMRSAEVASGLLGAGMSLLLILSGVILPLDALPAAMRHLAAVLPTTYLGDVLRHDLVGTVSAYAPWRSYAVMLGATVVLGALAVRTFRWDNGDHA